MRCWPIAVVFAAAIAPAGHADANQGLVPPPRPPAQCKPCEPPERRLQQLNARRDTLRERIARAEASIQSLQPQIDQDAAALAEAKKITNQALVEPRVRELERDIAINSMRQDIIRETKAEFEAELRQLEDVLIPEVRTELLRCNDSCTATDAPPAPGTAGDPPAPNAPPPPIPAPKCEPCEPPAEELTRLEEERRQLGEQIERLDAEIQELDDANAREQRLIGGAKESGKRDPRYAKYADEMVRGAEQRIDDNNKALDAKRGAREAARQRRSEIDQRLPQLRDAVNKCNAACRRPSTTTWYLLGGGGGALAVILATVGADQPAVVSTPVTTPTTVTTTQPQPQPQPPAPAQPVDPPPTVAGVHDCLECAVPDDSGRHNATIRLCDLAGGPWDVAVASITIRHAAPFVNIEGAPLDTVSGVFRGTTRGNVAGIPNVGIAFDGTANAQTGRISFMYTMGTGGELPGGRPITYAITLQKRR